MTRIVAALLALSIAGCSGAQAGYVRADRMTYEAVAPEYLDYVMQDPALSRSQRDRREATVESWRRRIEQAEGDE